MFVTALNASLEYSTTEQAVGKWIDGKTIYRIVLTGTLPSSAYASVANVSSLNIDKLLSIRLTITRSNNDVVYYGYNAGAVVYFNKSSGNINNSNDTQYAGSSFAMILEYTKN